MTALSLVDTNNSGPTITNRPLSLSQFHGGELAGIKLGMTMSEVVATWGKPHLVASRCVIGPRFWYRPGRPIGDVSLSFKDDKLVLIAITGRTAKDLVFDRGSLTGRVGRGDYERVLGEPSVQDPKERSLFKGQIVYRTGSLRMDFQFTSEDNAPAKKYLLWASVRIEAEARQAQPGEPAASPNGRPAAPAVNSKALEGGHR